METNQANLKQAQIQNQPAFDEDSFDLMEHKKAANTISQARAHEKRVRRKVVLGRIIIMILAMAVCGLLWMMASAIVGLL